MDNKAEAQPHFFVSLVSKIRPELLTGTIFQSKYEGSEGKDSMVHFRAVSRGRPMNIKS